MGGGGGGGVEEPLKASLHGLMHSSRVKVDASGGF